MARHPVHDSDFVLLILTTYRGKYNVILRDSEPIRLLESPRSLSVYILKTRYNIQTIFKSNEHIILYFRLLCKEIQESLDSGFHAVDSGFQALGITLLNELTKPPQAKMSRIQIPD